MSKPKKSTVSILVDADVKTELDTHLKDKQVSLKSVVEPYLRRWIIWAREGGVEPEIVAASERPMLPPSGKVLRAARALRTSIDSFVSQLQSDAGSDNNEELEPPAQKAKRLLAELSEVLGNLEGGLIYEVGDPEEAGASSSESAADAAGKYLQEREADRRAKGSDSGGSGGAGGVGTSGKP